MTKPIYYLRASSLKHSDCDLRFYLTAAKGYQTKGTNADIEFGSAFHLCAKITEETGGNIGKGVQAAVKYFRDTPMAKTKKYLTTDYLGLVCTSWYNDMYLTDTMRTLKHGEVPITEVKFALPFLETDWCHIMLSGTIDSICVHRQSDLICVRDYKTTAAWNIQEKLGEYELDGQMYFYTMVLRKFIEMSYETSVFHKYKGKDIGTFIDGIFLRAENKVEFKRSEVFIFKKERLEAFEVQVMSAAERLAKAIVFDTAPRTGILNGTCRRCDYSDVCKAPDEIAAEYVLKNNFKIKEYNPL